MPETRTRAPVPGAALARLLARMTGQDAPPPPQAPVERLGDWLEWQRAVALSRALDGEPGASAPGDAVPEPADAPANATDEALAAECRRVRAALEDAIADESRDWTLPLYPRRSEDPASAAAGAAAVQRHCQGLQRDLQSATGRLRGELRERLELRGGGPARLAAVDAVMEGLLAPREHELLAPLVPSLVARFEQMHARSGDAAAPAAAAAGSAPAEAAPAPAAGGSWRAAFRSEARQLLLAGLDLRFQPIEALLAALKTP